MWNFRWKCYCWILKCGTACLIAAVATRRCSRKLWALFATRNSTLFWPDFVWVIINPNYCSFWKPEPLCHHSALHQCTQMLIPMGLCTVKRNPRTRASAGCTVHPFLITQMLVLLLQRNCIPKAEWGIPEFYSKRYLPFTANVYRNGTWERENLTSEEKQHEREGLNEDFAACYSGLAGWFMCWPKNQCQSMKRNRILQVGSFNSLCALWAAFYSYLLFFFSLSYLPI